MHDLSQFMKGARNIQAMVDEMGLGDPLKKENADLRRQLAKTKGHVQHAQEWLDAAKGGLSHNVIFGDIDRAQEQLRQALEEATDETD